VHFIGAGLLGLGSFILVPLYTRTLRPDQFGIYALIDISVVILVLTSQAKLDVSHLQIRNIQFGLRGENENDISVVILVLTSQAKLDVSYLKMFADLDPSRYPAL